MIYIVLFVTFTVLCPSVHLEGTTLFKLIEDLTQLTIKLISIDTSNGISFDGDMILTEDQLDNLFSPARNGRIDEDFRWPNGIVPYAMNESHTKEQQDHIEKAFRKIESVSCIKFVPRTNENDYIQIMVKFQPLALILCSGFIIVYDC